MAKLTNEQKIERLKIKLENLEERYYNARCNSNQRIANMGFGYAQRHSKINFNTSKEDTLRDRIEKVKQQIKELEKTN